MCFGFALSCRQNSVSVSVRVGIGRMGGRCSEAAPPDTAAPEAMAAGAAPETTEPEATAAGAEPEVADDEAVCEVDMDSYSVGFWKKDGVTVTGPSGAPPSAMTVGAKHSNDPFVR